MPDRVPHLLFVCVENSCRSQMAEGFARTLGAGRVAAWSAGSRPAERVHPTAVRLMRERGIDLAAHEPKSLDRLPSIEWDAVVTMGCGDACPQLPAARRIEWDLPDPKRLGDDGFREVRDRIEARVRSLLAEIGHDPAEVGGATES